MTQAHLHPMIRHRPRAMLGNFTLLASAFVVATAPMLQGALQDNWAVDFTIAAPPPGIGFTSGIGVDSSDRIYVADAGNHVVHVFSPSGVFQKSLIIQSDDHMERFFIVGGDDRLYLSGAPPFKTVNHTVYTTDGVRIGRRSFDTAPLEAAAVDTNGEVYVVPRQRPAVVQVFSAGGDVVRTIGGPELLSLGGAISVSISPDGHVIVVTQYQAVTSQSAVLSYAKDGTFERRLPGTWQDGVITIGIDGLRYSGGSVITAEEETLVELRRSSDQKWAANPRTGAIYGSIYTGVVSAYRRGFRTLGASPPLRVPMPTVVDVVQRANGLVDLDCLVSDLDSSTVTTALCAYRGGSQVLKDLIPIPAAALVEGTQDFLGPGVPTGSSFHLVVNPATTLIPSGNLVFELFARDERPALLDRDYITLPGSPPLTICRSPVTHEDLRHVWAWLLATGDPELTRSADGEIVGPGGTYTTTVEVSYGSGVFQSRTTAEGRTWIFARLGAREATPAELSRARQASAPGTPNQFAPLKSARSLGDPAGFSPNIYSGPDGRPMAANEWTFDSWDKWNDPYGSVEGWWLVPVP